MKDDGEKRTPGLRQTPSGKWQARYYDPQGRLRGQTFVRKTDAKAFLVEVKADVKRGNWIDPARSAIRLGDWARQWLDHKLNLRRASFARDEGCVRNQIVPAFGSTPIGRIARADIQRWVKELSDGGLSAASVRRCHRVLNSILAEAVNDRLIPESPCRRISLPRLPNRECLYLTAEEVERLATAIDPLFRALVYSAVYLGCRWGELAGLRRENLDLVRRQVRIVGTLEEVGSGPVYIEETKTRTSRRMLTFPPFLAELLAEHLSRVSLGEFVFLGRTGSVLRRGNFRLRHWKPGVAAAGLDQGLRFHDLRHSCAALLVAQGAHPKEIQARLGHSSITTTLNTYGHLWPTLGVQLDEKIEAVFRQAKTNVAQMWPAGRTEVVPMRGAEQGSCP
ncbi:MAG: tyrosine-type recombinase/integrase [Actinomycetota bacterium]